MYSIRRVFRRVVGALLVGAGAVVGAELITARRGALILAPPISPGTVDLGSAKLHQIHLVVLGDSTAVGVGADNVEETYPWRVARMLSDRFRIRLDVIGRPGARMIDLQSEFVPRALTLNPDLVLIGLGANDVVHGTIMRRVDRYLDEAIKQLRGAGCHVLVALGPRFDPPILGRFLKRIVKARARMLNRTIGRVAKRRYVTVIDLPAGVGTAFADQPTRYYSRDRYHPGPQGYALWAEVLREPLLHAAGIIAPQPLSGRRHGEE